jgi:hypothetical protein
MPLRIWAGTIEHEVGRVLGLRAVRRWQALRHATQENTRESHPEHCIPIPPDWSTSRPSQTSQGARRALGLLPSHAADNRRRDVVLLNSCFHLSVFCPVCVPCETGHKRDIVRKQSRCGSHSRLLVHRSITPTRATLRPSAHLHPRQLRLGSRRSCRQPEKAGHLFAVFPDRTGNGELPAFVPSAFQPCMKLSGLGSCGFRRARSLNRDRR